MIKLINITVSQLEAYRVRGTFYYFETDQGKIGAQVIEIARIYNGYRVVLDSTWERYLVWLFD